MKYKAILTILIVAIVSVSFGQSNAKSPLKKQNLNKDAITLIEISNYCGPMDSCRMKTYKLTNSMTEGLVDRLNKSDSKGPCEFVCEYWLYIYFTDGTLRSYITNGVLFGEVKENDVYPSYTTKIEADDLCLKIEEPNHLINLWTELEKNSKK